MAIEPISSIMTIQAQPVQKAEPVAPVESTDASTQVEKAPDKTTVFVDKSMQKEEGSNGQTQAQSQPQTNDQVKQAIEKLNKSMTNSEAVFGIHEGTNRVTIKIIDKNTKEVIKELPPEKTLDMIAKVWEMAGILVDEKR